MALMVFLQENEDVPSVYRNLKIFCEMAPSLARVDIAITSDVNICLGIHKCRMRICILDTCYRPVYNAEDMMFRPCLIRRAIT